MISQTTILYAAQGVEDVVQAERRVRGAISETARTAARDEAKTKRWMEQHKTALLAIGAATGAAMAAIIASSPSLSASLGEVHLWFSMLAMEMGENVAPVFEWLASLTETLYTWFTELPKPVQTLISYIALLVLGLGIIVPLVAGMIWSLGMLKAAFVGLSMPALVVGGALTTLGLIVGVLGGLVLGGVGVWALWKLGVIQAVEDAGASVGRFAYNAGVVVGNLSRNIIDGLKLLATSAAVYGADFALSWADGVAKNIPIVGGRISEMIGSVRSVLDSAKTDLAAQWEDFDLTGGLTVGMQVGELRPGRTVSDAIAGADTAVFGGGVDTSSSQAELQRLQELMQEFNSTMPSETAAAAADTNAALAGLDTGLSTTATNATATKTEMERLQAVMGGFNSRTPGLSQTADDAKTTGDAVKTTATDTATAAAEIEQSLSAMDSGFSDTSASVTATTAAMTTTVSGQFDSVALSGGRWGSDLMGRFIAGLNSRQGELSARLAAIRASIESALSFDIRSNDLAAERWGRDLGQYFASGLSGEIGTVAGVSGGYRAAAMPSSVSSSSSSTSVNLGGVSINISGADTGKLDEAKLARLITQQVKTEVGSAVRGRAR